MINTYFNHSPIPILISRTPSASRPAPSGLCLTSTVPNLLEPTTAATLERPSLQSLPVHGFPQRDVTVTADEDAMLTDLKQIQGLYWEQIKRKSLQRSFTSFQDHYPRKVKQKGQANHGQEHE